MKTIALNKGMAKLLGKITEHLAVFKIGGRYRNLHGDFTILLLIATNGHIPFSADEQHVLNQASILLNKINDREERIPTKEIEECIESLGRISINLIKK